MKEVLPLTDLGPLIAEALRQRTVATFSYAVRVCESYEPTFPLPRDNECAKGGAMRCAGKLSELLSLWLQAPLTEGGLRGGSSDVEQVDRKRVLIMKALLLTIYTGPVQVLYAEVDVDMMPLTLRIEPREPQGELTRSPLTEGAPSGSVALMGKPELSKEAMRLLRKIAAPLESERVDAKEHSEELAELWKLGLISIDGLLGQASVEPTETGKALVRT
jgi:hypothetical protein